MTFDYTLSIKFSWPPSGRPKPPFGPTIIEVIRSCPLRSLFEFSSGYERRIGVAARIGTAMHKTLQSLSEQPIQDNILEKIAAEAKHRFYAELELQKNQSTKHPREARLQWDPVRIERSVEAVIAEALRTRDNQLNQKGNDSSYNGRVNQSNFSIINPEHLQTDIELPAHEVLVQSKDQLFRGRIDRVERIAEGIRLVDYKSAYRDDLPERYARQIQLYAYLWFETTNEWPVEGQVFYPLKGTFYQVPINADTCKQVVSEAVTIIHQLGEHMHPRDMAMPGDTCKVCDYRPWCQPFWVWQTSEKILIKAKENAAIGFEGRLESISVTKHYWRLEITWNGIKVRLVVPQERFPHLASAKTGQMLRFLDAPLKGALNQPTVQVFDTTEIFLLS